MNFIKLTMARTTGYGGEPIYINARHIEAIKEGDDHTILFVIGDNNAKYYVMESAEAVLALIAKLDN